jgi:hypothetical protein
MDFNGFRIAQKMEKTGENQHGSNDHVYSMGSLAVGTCQCLKNSVPGILFWRNPWLGDVMCKLWKLFLGQKPNVMWQSCGLRSESIAL